MLRYRLSDKDDPEERLEDAALWKALKDVLGDDVMVLREESRGAPIRMPPKIQEIIDATGGPTSALEAAPDDPRTVLLPGDILVGAPYRNEHVWSTPRLAKPFLAYWNDPGFLRAAGRRFELHDFSGARAAIDRLHEEGKGAFLKSVRTKFWVQRIPLGTDPWEAIGDMAYSFIDQGPCLMVQELVPMECEMRFAVMGGQVVAQSPVAYWLTPLDRELAIDKVARTPSSTVLEHDPATVRALEAFARATAASLEEPDCILDVCMSEGRPIAIELNALSLGQFGIYAMDVRAIAAGVKDILLPRLENKAPSP